jgi:6-phosphogluconolactonase
LESKVSTLPRVTHPGEFRVYRDGDHLAKAAAELFVQLASESITSRGRFRVVLSGGSTPRRTFEVLATPEFSSGVDWSRVDIFWGDERYVSANDPESNYRMAREALLQRVPVPAANVYRVPTEISPPQTAANTYEDRVLNCFGNHSGAPQFDLIYLGLGTNGHTASLFPHSRVLHEKSHLVAAVFVPGVQGWRITMTAGLLNHARTVAFLVSGTEKAQVLRDVVLGPRDPERLPAQMIIPDGRLLWMADEPAAALVSDTRKQRKRG